LGTSRNAWQTSELLVVPVSSSWAGDYDLIFFLGLGDALEGLCIPVFSSSASDAGLSVEVGSSWTLSNALSLVGNGVTNALSTTSSNEVEVSVRKV